MQTKEYTLLAAIEDVHWFFAGRKKIINSVVSSYLRAADIKILDIGCGTGGLSKTLTAYGEVFCADSSAVALEFCRTRGLSNISLISREGVLPFTENKFDVVCAFDVLEHAAKEAEFLREAVRVAKHGALMFITVPAYKFMWSLHDDVNQHWRRYTKSSLAAALSQVDGVEVLRMSYFNTLLFPAAAAFRLGKKFLEGCGMNFGTGSDQSFELPGVLNSLLLDIFSTERSMLKCADLPFGLSIVAVVKVK